MGIFRIFVDLSNGMFHNTNCNSQITRAFRLRQVFFSSPLPYLFPVSILDKSNST